VENHINKLYLTVGLWIVLQASAFGSYPSENPTIYPTPEKERGTIIGFVTESETGEPIVFATIRLKDTGRYRISRSDGSFQFDGLSARRFILSVEHISYSVIEKIVDLRESDTAYVYVELAPSVFELSGSVIVTGIGRERGVAETYQPTEVLGGIELQRRLQGNLSATLLHIPGISQQYFGPAASQPIIRGMGGDRMLILEDGQRTGDLSTTGADHAVTVEPLTAERIEVVRGPAGLLYGSNALGGVINVIREEVPRSVPQSLSGTVTLGGESVYNGLSSGITLLVPWRSVVIRAEASGRRAEDTRTPQGVLHSTDMLGYNVSSGVSWVSGWGYAGLAYRQIEMKYGIPGEFNGVPIPGAHFGGVDIEYTRRTVRLKGAYTKGLGPFSDFEFDGSVSHYLHDEIEGRGESGPFYGTRFDQITGSGTMIVRHVHRDGQLRSEGAFGISMIGRDLIAGGGYSGTRSATEIGAAAFIYEEFSYGSFRLQTGLRFDWREVKPYSYNPIKMEGSDIPVRDRRFSALSGSVALLYQVGSAWKLGINIARAFRSPSIEELYSDGPHLADFSYDIGNPELDSEYGVGIDLFTRMEYERLKIEINGFRNFVYNYIYPGPTGGLDPRFRRFPLYQTRSGDALFFGAEGKMQWEFIRSFLLEGSFSFVDAKITETSDNLPSIPPLSIHARLRYEGRRIFASVGWEAAGDQKRVPNPIPSPLTEGEYISPQNPTPGYNLLHVGAGYRWMQKRTFHSIVVEVRNITDSVWRDHLSRIKEVAPQPGRNIQMSYRLMF
jgi:iron complex outermembrane recepter protein